MYLSKLTLNLKSRTVQNDLADCQSLHRRLMAAFPQAPVDANAREYFGVLYRLDFDRGEEPLLVQSRVEPDWSRLPGDYVYGALPKIKDLTEAYSVLAAGQVLTFRLRANVTKKINTKSGPDGKRRHGARVEVWDEERRLEWLTRKGAAAGFDILIARVNGGRQYPMVRANPGGKVWGKKKTRAEQAEGKGRITFGGVVFEGALRISDPARFREAVAAGIGPAKAYGFGLLSVAPAR